MSLVCSLTKSEILRIHIKLHYITGVEPVDSATSTTDSGNSENIHSAADSQVETTNPSTYVVSAAEQFPVEIEKEDNKPTNIKSSFPAKDDAYINQELSG